MPLTLPRSLPDQAVLRHLVDYNPTTGELIWRERPVEFFNLGADGRFRTDRRDQWNTRYSGTAALACVDGRGYRAGRLFHHHCRAHRVIWKWMTGKDAREVDHINGDRMDNRWVNLREVTRSENCRNTVTPRHNSSGRVGVRCTGRGYWLAYIKINGRQTQLGNFRTREAAVAARAAAEVQYGYHANHGRAQAC